MEVEQFINGLCTDTVECQLKEVGT